MQSEVFRPSSGPLMVRGNLSDGLAPNTDVFRKGSGSRPSTQSGYRFGQLSQNAFFARHNPHPAKVRHIKGLLDVPICAVNDGAAFASPRYSLSFPPNSYNNKKLKLSDIPVNALNVNSQRLPLDTITGLQYFTGKNFQFMTDKASPDDAKFAISDVWENELKALTKAATMKNDIVLPRTPGEGNRTPGEGGRPRTSQYSANTGRLIPPPSRAMSRGNSRASRRDQAFSRFQELAADPEVEFQVLQLVCQILQTDDINAAKSWLVSAPDKEKALMLYMVRAALSTNEDNQRQGNMEYMEPGTTLPALPQTLPGDTLPNNNDSDDLMNKIDRLTLDNVSPRPASGMREETKFMRHSYTPVPEDDTNKADAFRPLRSSHGNRPGSQTDRPTTGQIRPFTPGKPCTPAGLGQEPKLRYTTTPSPEQNQKPSLLPEGQTMWQPDQSIGN